MYWQRHHLVENFIDAYVWDRWHVSNPPPPPLPVAEQLLDTVTKTPNVMGSGAPFTFARLNDHISIGIDALGDPIDKIVRDVADAIRTGPVDLGISVVQDPLAPNDPEFVALTKMLEQALKDVYKADPHPKRLAGGLNPRPGGYPTSDDIAAAYGAMRLFLKLSTEDKIQEPQPPNILTDISKEVQQLVNDIAHDVGAIRPPPLPNFHGHFSVSSLWDAIKNSAAWVADTAVKVVKTVVNFIKNYVKIVATAVADVVKFGLFVINKTLFSLYRYFRDVLVFGAYNIPFTDELAMPLGDQFNTTALWQTPGNLGAGQYPVEEIPAESMYIFSNYSPIIPPNAQTPTPSVEQPPIQFTAPYRPGLPELFIDAPDGTDDLFSVNGPVPVDHDDSSRKFGGALAICHRGIMLATGKLPGPLVLPQYNLDGDRGYAWPCWQVKPEPPDPPDPRHAGDPLDPTNPQNNGTATVRPVLI